MHFTQSGKGKKTFQPFKSYPSPKWRWKKPSESDCKEYCWGKGVNLIKLTNPGTYGATYHYGKNLDGIIEPLSKVTSPF